MSMIKDAIKYVLDLGINPDERFVDVVDRNGVNRTFVIGNEGVIQEVKPKIERADHEMVINTLTGLVNYVKANVERIDYKFILQVYDEETVFLKGLLDSEGGRESLVTARAIVPSFNYDRFFDVEELIINLQSKFVSSEDTEGRLNDRELVLKVVGNIKEENVQKTGDDGMSQAVTVQSGLSNVQDVLVPNPVKLVPYRTFLEVEQPASDFIFRMRKGPAGAIFEADGGAWRNEAITNVRDYLATELADEIENGRITIIA